MQEVKFPVNLINNVLTYLSTRPYQEVYTLIHGIQTIANEQLPKADEAEVKEEE
mgnify:CR=1 FL=1